MILATVASQVGFWPHTLGAWAAIAATLTGAGAGAVSWRNHGKIETVKLLVNGRISRIERDLADVSAERDRLKYARGVLVGGRRRNDPESPPEVDDDVQAAQQAANYAVQELARIVGSKETPPTAGFRATPPVTPPTTGAAAPRPVGTVIP